MPKDIKKLLLKADELKNGKELALAKEFIDITENVDTVIGKIDSISDEIKLRDQLKEIQDKEENKKEVEISKINGVEMITLKGEKGDTPQKGKDYFTDEEVKSFLNKITPVKGKDYFDGKQGPQGPEGKQGPQGPQGPQGDPGINGRNGKDGRDGSPDTAEQIVEKLESLTEESRLDASAIKNLPEFIQGDKRIGFGSMLKEAPKDGLIYGRQNRQWVEVTSGGGGGGTPAGSDTQIQYNNAGAFGASSDFTRNDELYKSVVRTVEEPKNPTFSGSGLNDLSFSGTFTGENTTTYTITIASTGMLDTFDWTDGTNSGYGSNCNTSPGLLSNGVYIEFTNNIGHTVGDSWTFTFGVSKSVIKQDVSESELYSLTEDGKLFGFRTNQDGTVTVGNFAIGSAIKLLIDDTAKTAVLGNPSGGNNTKITIDDVAQTINFNGEYSFPFADGTSGQTLVTDGAGTLSWAAAGGGGTWGSITGTLSNQTDLQNALNAKQDTITTGTTAQYFRGDLSLATFPTLVSSFTNDSGFITSSALSPYLPLTGAIYATTTGNGLSLTTSTLTTGSLVSLSSTGTGAGSNTQTVLNIATSGANGTSSQTTYGAYVTNTHTGTTSTNVGLYVSASGATNNYGLIVANGNVGIGQTSPTARLHIAAGTASAGTSPLKFTSGTNLTTPEAGAMEYDGTSLYFSPSTTRRTVVLDTATQTLTNKRINPRVQAVTSASTVTPSADNDDEVVITAQGTALTLANWSGTPVQGQAIIIRIKDDNTARAITFDTLYRAVGAYLPTTTVIGKTVYIACIYNSTDTKIDVVSVAQEI